MLNPTFGKKVRGQKHPGKWGIVEHQIPSIKVLFKTDTKSHKHPGIKLLSESKTQLVKQRKQDSYKRAYIYIYIYYHRASGREQRSSGGNTSSNPRVSAPVPRPVVNGMERMCQRHGSDQTHVSRAEFITANFVHLLYFKSFHMLHVQICVLAHRTSWLRLLKGQIKIT